MKENWKTEWEAIRHSPRLTWKNFLPLLFVRFGSRDLLWATLVFAIALGWYRSNRAMHERWEGMNAANTELIVLVSQLGFELPADDSDRRDTIWIVPPDLRAKYGDTITIKSQR